MFEGLRTSTDLVVMVITLLAFGCPVQAIVQAYGLDERTVASWRDRAGKQCQRVHQAVVEQGHLDLVHVQADEIRVKARGMVVWMGLSLMGSTRLWLGGVVSQTRDTKLADRLLQQVRACCQKACDVLICTDGWAAYVRRVGVFEILVRHGRGREQEPLGQELTRRGNSKVDCSMLLKRKTREDMYLAVLQVLCAW
jgi:transposase-like protein